MGRTSTRLEGEVMKEIIRLYIDQGESLQKVARRLKVWIPRLKQALLDHGIEVRQQTTSQEKCDAIAADYVYGGLDNEAISRKHRVTDKVVYRLVRQRGLKRQVEPIATTAYERREGRTVYQQWVFRYGREEANRRQAAYVAKCRVNSRGTGNPMYGKASPQGSGNGWKGRYKGAFFRSLRELVYLMTVLESGVQWESGEKGGYRMRYVDWEGRERTYAPDYAILSTKTLVEVKPKRLWESPSVKSKAEAARAWCAERGWTYQLVDPVIDTKLVLTAHRRGLIEWTPRSRERFERYYKATEA